MAFKDLLVPKWKHSRAEVRIAAIDNISNDLNILREIAETDTSPQVRIAAILKIGDEPILTKIIKNEKDEQVLEVAKKQQESLLKKIITTSNDQKAIIAALEKYNNEKVTAGYLCDNNTDVSVQRTLIKQVKSHQLLTKITEHECAFEIAEKIVEQITEKELLERISQKASNKKIRIIAQEKISALFTDPLAEERAITKKLQQCCSGMDIQVSPRNHDLALDLLDISRNLWNKYDPQRQHPLAETYAAAEKLLLNRIEQSNSQKVLLETLETLCQKAEQLISQPADTLEKQFEQLHIQWNAVDRSIIESILTISLDDRFKKAKSKIESAIKLSNEANEQLRRNEESLELSCNELEHFVNSSSVSDEKLWQRMQRNWDLLCLKHTPDELLKKRFEKVKEKYQEKINEKAQLEKNTQQNEIEDIEHLATEMESIAKTANEQNIRSLHQQVLRIKQEWDKSWPLARSRKTELQSSFTNNYKDFMNVYYELREQSSWQQWANEHAKVKILDEFEQLENRIQQGEPLQKISRKVSLFQNQWRAAFGGKSEKTREMDERFSAVRERIYSLMLAKKTGLLESLKTILNESTDKDLAEEVKAIQRQWSDIGYLPPELEKDLPDTFYGLCNTFFEQRKEQYQKYTEDLEKNSAIRKEICAEAEKLSDSTDWKATKDAFTQLQKRWDESWPAPYKLSQELWQQYCKCRDLFFEHYDTFKSENDKLKEDLCEKAEHLLSQLHEAELIVQNSQIECETEIFESPTVAEHEMSVESGSEPVSGSDISTVNQPESTTANNDITDSGTVNDSQVETDSEPSIGSENPEEADVTKDQNVTQVNFAFILNEAIRLQKSWKESGPASRERSEELWERFNSTLRKIFSIIDEDHRKNFDLKEALVKEAESLTLSEDFDTASERFHDIRAEWKTIQPAARRDEQALWNRLQAAGDTFFGRRRAHFDNYRNIVNQNIDEKEALLAELEILIRISGKSHLLKTSENQSAAEVLKKGIELRNQLVVDGDPEKTYNNIKQRALDIIDIWEKDEPLRGKDFYRLDKRFDELLGILKRR